MVPPTLRAVILTDETDETDNVAGPVSLEVGATDVFALLDPARREELDRSNREEQERLREQFAGRRTRQLHDAGKISELDLLKSAAELAAARGQRDVARTRHDRSAIKAPFAGIVADRYVEPGELVSPGTPVARVDDLACGDRPS